MSQRVTYFPGGFLPAAAAQNKAEQWDSATGIYTRWDAAGVQQQQRALTGAEAAELAAMDTSNIRVANTDTLRVRAQAALATNATYLALATPTNAQVAAQVNALTKECSALIRLLIGQLDTIAGT